MCETSVWVRKKCAKKSVCVKKKKKILELTEQKEAVLFDKIPRKKDMSLRTALREVKREEAEKLRFFSTANSVCTRRITLRIV